MKKLATLAAILATAFNVNAVSLSDCATATSTLMSCAQVVQDCQSNSSGSLCSTLSSLQSSCTSQSTTTGCAFLKWFKNEGAPSCKNSDPSSITSLSTCDSAAAVFQSCAQAGSACASGSSDSFCTDFASAQASCKTDQSGSACPFIGLLGKGAPSAGSGN